MEFLILVGGALFLYYFFKVGTTSSKGQERKTNRPNSNNEIHLTAKTSNQVVASRNRDDDDDGLATFSISYGYNEEKSKNATHGKWIKSGESISIKGKTFTGGNFYFGGKLSSLDRYGTEASLVDDSLKVRWSTPPGQIFNVG